MMVVMHGFVGDEESYDSMFYGGVEQPHPSEATAQPLAQETQDLGMVALEAGQASRVFAAGGAVTAFGMRLLPSEVDDLHTARKMRLRMQFGPDF